MTSFACAFSHTRGSRPPSSLITAVIALAIAACVCPRSLHAQIATWQNTTPGTQDWQLGTNWTTGTAPSAQGATANVIADITAPQTINLNGAVTLGTLTIGDPAATAALYTLASGSNSGRLIFDVASGNASLTQTASSAANLISAGITLNDGLIVTNNAESAALTLSGIIIGTGGLTKSGAGTVTLSGANQYSGGTTITAGTLKAGAGEVLSNNGAVTMSGGTLDITAYTETINNLVVNSAAAVTSGTLSSTRGFTVSNGAGVVTISSVLTNPSGATGGLTKSGAGQLTLSAANTYAGPTVVTGGTLKASVGTALPSTTVFSISNATLDLTGVSATVGSFSGTNDVTMTTGTLTATSGYTFATTTGTATINGVLAGSNATLTKNGAGTLLLNGTHTATGAVTLNAGTLRIAGNDRIGAAAITLAGGTLDLQGFSDTVTSVTASSASAITAGTLATTAATGFTFSNTSGTTTVGAVLAGTNLTRSGAGTLVLNAANTYTGTTAISGGVLRLGDSERIANSGTISLGAATLDLAGFSETVSAVSVTAAGTITGGTLVADSYAVSNASGTAQIDAILSGAAAFTKSGAGTVLFNGANTYTGTTSISAGTLRIGASERIANTSDLTMTSGTLDLAGFTETVAGFSLTAGTVNAGTLVANGYAIDNAAAATISASLGGSGSLTKTGTGALTLGGANSFTGGTTINAGGVTVSGAGAVLGGNVLVNSGGTLTNSVAGGLTGNVTVDGGVLTGASATTLTSLVVSAGTVSNSGAISTTSGVSVTAASGTVTFSGLLGGTGGFTKTNAGTVVLSGANSGFTGLATLDGGTIQSGATSTLGSGTLKLVSGVISSSGTAARSLGNSAVVFDGNVTIGDATNSGALTFSGSGVLTADRTLTFASDATFSGPLTGAAGFTKSGGGTLTLNGANTYQGTTDVSQGVLVLTAAAGVEKSGTTRLDGGTLRIGNNTALGGDTLELVSGAFTANLSTGRSLANNVTLDGNVTLGAGTTNTGTLTFTGTSTLTGSRTLTTSVATTFSGPITESSGTFSLTKEGSASLVLSGSNGYTGGTVIKNGQLTFSSSNALPASGSVDIEGGTLVASGPFSTVTGWLDSGRIAASPNGSIAITGNSSEAINFSAYPTLALGASTTATYSGALTPYESNNVKTYRFGGGNGQLTVSSSLADNVVASTTYATKVVIRGDGSGVVRMGANNSYTGGLYLDSGTLDVNADNQINEIDGQGTNAIFFEGGTLRYSTTTTDFSNKFAPVASGYQASINTNGLNVTFNTPITGAGGLSKIGTGTLTATAHYTGATSVSGGILALTLSDTVAAPTGNVSASNSGTLRLTSGTDRTLTARFTQQSGGAVELAATNGSTLTMSGTLQRISGTASAPGPIAVTAGRVIFDGFASSPVDTDWTVTSGTLLLSSTRAPDLNDSVTVAAGALVQLGQANQILTTGSIGGTFDLAGFDETLQTITGSGIVTNANSGVASTLTLTTTGTLAATLTNATANGLSLVLNGTTGGQVFTIGNAANSYGGGTTLNAGVLSLAGNDVLGAGGLAVIGSATTVQVRSSSATARVYAGSLSLRDAVVLGDATSTGELTFSGATTLAAATTITGSSTVTLSGAIGDGSAGYGLTKTGAALLVLSGTNTYSGVTTLAAGTLRAAGVNTSNGSTLVQSGSLQLGADNPLAGGALQLDGGTVSSDSTTARRLDNAITLSGSIVLGNATNTGGLTLANAMTISGTGRQLNVASPVEISGAIGDGGQSLGFTKLGTGVLTLSGTNTYSGTTAITAGTLLARGVNTSGGATSLAGAVLQLGHDNPLASGTLTFTSGTLSSDGTTARSLSTPTLLAGNVTMGDATNSGGLTFTGGFALSNASTLMTASDVVVNSGITSNNSNRTLTKQGAGTLTINAASTHGGTTLTAGRLRVGAANALGTTQTVTLSGGALSSNGTTDRTLANALTINGNSTIGDVVDSGVMTFTGAAAVSNNPTLTIASDVVMSRFTGTGQTFTKAGNSRITLTGASTMTGTTVLTAGTLFMQSGASLAATSSLVVNNGATLAGTGTAGAVWINDGGTISPGNSPGTSFAGNVTLEAGGNYNWQLYDALGTAGTGWDLINLSMIGLLDLTGLSEANRFNINTWTLSGTGPDVNGAPLNFVYETGTSYRFSVIAVNEISSILLPASLGTPVADMDITSLFTLNTSAVNGTGGWQSPTPAAWNMTVKIGVDGKSIDIIVVPEPATIVLVGIGAALAAAARRRQPGGGGGPRRAGFSLSCPE